MTAFKASLQNHVAAVLETAVELLWLAAVPSRALGGPIPVGIHSGPGSPDVVRCRSAIGLAATLVGIVVRRTVMRSAITQAFPSRPRTCWHGVPCAWTSSLSSLTLGSRSVGVYSPAVSLVNSTFLLPAAFFSVMVPTLSNAFAVDRSQGVASIPSSGTVSWSWPGALRAGSVCGGLAHRFVLGGAYREVGDLVRLLQSSSCCSGRGASRRQPYS